MADYVRVCGTNDVPDECAKRVMVGDVPVCVVQTEGEFFAIYDVCSHEEVPLSEGDVDEGTIECYLHGSRFDLQSGRPIGLPATVPVPVYPVKVEGDDVYVAVEEQQ